MFAPVYLDHNATTPVDARVLEAMLPYLREQYGNASSRHEYGRAARRAVDEARQQVAAAVGAHPTEVLFTSGGSEANNLFLKGAAASFRHGGLLVVSAIEHPCVRNTARQLGRQGWQVHELAVDAAGRVLNTELEAVLAGKPRLVSVMLANNETGVLQDLPALAGTARSCGAWFHTDAVQALGKLPLDFRALNRAGIHALTVSAHKIGGPKGAAALVLDKRVDLAPLIAGGGQERGLRSGTENVAAIVGFGRACELAVSRLESLPARLAILRDRLEAGLQRLGAVIFGAGADRLPNTSYFAFADLDGETLVGRLDRAGFAVASGAACSSANPEPSHVLQAMGVPERLSRGAVRVSLGAETSEENIDQFLGALEITVAGLKNLTALGSRTPCINGATA
ncbi:cysteine desulfurase family protein [Azovibrio restrictus]|uniref:cysteine desulfurase family protein n=1 Tax=Azovibrio restrictus TaxID=146938 RepID=UPI0026E98AB7|nr:cysteine desulfurase family protein [Azovibrio restrictus]